MTYGPLGPREKPILSLREKAGLTNGESGCTMISLGARQ